MLNESCGAMANFYILLHKKNEKRDTWYYMSSEGAAKEFGKKFKIVRKYWRHFLFTYVMLVLCMGTSMYRILLCIINHKPW